MNEVEAFLDEMDLPYLVLADPEGTAREMFASRFIPASFLLNTRGEIVERKEGPITLGILEQWLAELSR